MIKKYSSEHGNCKLTLGQETLGWHPMYFGVPKSSPYVTEINKAYYYYIFFI